MELPEIILKSISFIQDMKNLLNKGRDESEIKRELIDIAIGNISNLFGCIRGNMSFNRILRTYRLDGIIPDGNKTERLAETIRYIIDNQNEQLINFLNMILNQHNLANGDLSNLKQYLIPLNLTLENNQIIISSLYENFYEFFEESLSKPEVLPAIHGKSDGAIITFSEKLSGITDDFIVVDFGCGTGRLVEGFRYLDLKLLEKIHYIGVDINKSNLDNIERYIKNTEFDKLIKDYNLFNTEDFIKEDIEGDFIFLINVLHEINLKDIPYILSNLESKLKTNGMIIIHEMSELIEGELNFVSWEKKDFEILLEKSNLTLHTHIYETRRGIPLINSTCIKIIKENTPINIYEENIITFIKDKQIRIKEEINEIYKSEEKTKRLAYLLVLQNNILRQAEHLPSFD